MQFTFTSLEPEYQAMLAAAKVTEASAAKAVATKLLANKARFAAVEKTTGVPAIWIMPVWWRENPSFNSYLGNGDSLHRATVHVPKGRGPFGSWEEGAEDALKLDHITEVASWSWPRACYQWELWNGFGPRMHGRPTGYVWAGTDQYRGGKYVADGVWSPGTWDKQLGTYCIAQALIELDPDLSKPLETA